MHLFAAFLFLLTFVAAPSPCAAAAQTQKKDYLSALDAGKIRDAESPSERIKLFLEFADDRLKKFQYELAHPSPNHHAVILNALLNAYASCVDDAADRIEAGVEKQENLRKGVDLMILRAGEFLAVLKQIEAAGTELSLYKENLDDAIEGTTDALHDAQKARKELAPPPVRRRNGP